MSGIFKKKRLTLIFEETIFSEKYDSLYDEVNKSTLYTRVLHVRQHEDRHLRVADTQVVHCALSTIK